MISAASMATPIARFFGAWNCAQLRSSIEHVERVLQFGKTVGHFGTSGKWPRSDPVAAESLRPGHSIGCRGARAPGQNFSSARR